jgi:hypothetical protein
MAEAAEADPIWGETPRHIDGVGAGDLEVDSDRCGGRFRISGSALVELPSLTREQKAKLTTLIVESNRLGEPLLVTTYTFGQLAAIRSRSVAERMDRLLAYFVHRDFRPGHSIEWLTMHSETAETLRSKHQAAAWIEAQELRELPAFRDLLEGAGYLRHTGSHVFITAPGFARMDELRRGGAPTNNAFIAMWFGDEMSAIYDDGILPAVTDTGFTPVRIDRKEHINKIDDEIVAEIKRARFVIADFTSGVVETDDGSVLIPRGGVYYEAGLAQGRDIPVIWAVRADQIDRVHFDTRQFNHIAWTDAADLRFKLTNRIRAIFADAT